MKAVKELSDCMPDHMTALCTVRLESVRYKHGTDPCVNGVAPRLVTMSSVNNLISRTPLLSTFRLFLIT